MTEAKENSSSFVPIRPASTELLKPSVNQDYKQSYFHVAGFPEPRLDPWSMFYSTAHPTMPSPYYSNPYAAYRDVLPFGLYSFAPLYSIEDEKPAQSYIGLIAQAILNSSEKKLILGDIYNYILAHYPYFRNKGTGWRNSVRHNLSLNPCFVKAGRSPNGKGHFWAINSEFYDDFVKGNFRRRKVPKRGKGGCESEDNEEAGDIKLEKFADTDQVEIDNDVPTAVENHADKDSQEVENSRKSTDQDNGTVLKTNYDEHEPSAKRKRLETIETASVKPAEKRVFDVESLLEVKKIKKESPKPALSGICSPCTAFSPVTPQTTWSSLNHGYSGYSFPPRTLPFHPVPYQYSYPYSRPMYATPQLTLGQNVY